MIALDLCISFIDPITVQHVCLRSTQHAAKNNTWYLDLASGSGEHVTTLYRSKSDAADALPSLVLSDLFPQIGDWQALQSRFGKEKLAFCHTSVSVLDVPLTFSRDWTIFTAFHHFPPDMAKQLLSQAIAKANSLHIAEITRRRWLDIIMMLMVLPTLILAPFFARKITLRKLLITSILPIVPLMVICDGIVSCLRSYTRDEIVAMLPEDALKDFRYEYHEMPVPLVPVPLKSTLFSLYRIVPLPAIVPNMAAVDSAG